MCLAKMSQPQNQLEKISQTQMCFAKISQGLPKIRKLVLPCEIQWEIWKRLRIYFATKKSISQPCKFQQPLCKMPTVSGKAKGHLKQAYLKTSRCPICLYSFSKPIYSLRNLAPHCQLVFSSFHALWPPFWRGDLHLSLHFDHDAH